MLLTSTSITLSVSLRYHVLGGTAVSMEVRYIPVHKRQQMARLTLTIKIPETNQKVSDFEPEGEKPLSAFFHGFNYSTMKSGHGRCSVHNLCGAIPYFIVRVIVIDCRNCSKTPLLWHFSSKMPSRRKRFALNLYFGLSIQVGKMCSRTLTLLHFLAINRKISFLGFKPHNAIFPLKQDNHSLPKSFRKWFCSTWNLLWFKFDECPAHESRPQLHTAINMNICPNIDQLNTIRRMILSWIYEISETK